MIITNVISFTERLRALNSAESLSHCVLPYPEIKQSQFDLVSSLS